MAKRTVWWDQQPSKGWWANQWSTLQCLLRIFCQIFPRNSSKTWKHTVTPTVEQLLTTSTNSQTNGSGRKTARRYMPRLKTGRLQFTWWRTSTRKTSKHSTPSLSVQRLPEREWKRQGRIQSSKAQGIDFWWQSFDLEVCRNESF